VSRKRTGRHHFDQNKCIYLVGVCNSSSSGLFPTKNKFIREKSQLPREIGVSLKWVSQKDLSLPYPEMMLGRGRRELNWRILVEQFNFRWGAGLPFPDCPPLYFHLNNGPPLRVQAKSFVLILVLLAALSMIFETNIPTCCRFHETLSETSLSIRQTFWSLLQRFECLRNMVQMFFIIYWINKDYSDSQKIK